MINAFLILIKILLSRNRDNILAFNSSIYIYFFFEYYSQN